MKNGFPKQKSDPPASYRGRLGRRGEDVAAAFFLLRGFTVVDRNWRCRFGEIDLVVRKGQELRFVEVKMRKTHAFGYPEASVTPSKLRHLQAAVQLWLRQAAISPKNYQMDVLAISCLNNAPPQFHWIEGV